jgi:hypothetical protein
LRHATTQYRRGDKGRTKRLAINYRVVVFRVDYAERFYAFDLRSCGFPVRVTLKERNEPACIEQRLYRGRQGWKDALQTTLGYFHHPRCQIDLQRIVFIDATDIAFHDGKAIIDGVTEELPPERRRDDGCNAEQR